MFRREFFTKCLGVLAGLVGVKAAGATYSGGLVTKPAKKKPFLTWKGKRGSGLVAPNYGRAHNVQSLLTMIRLMLDKHGVAYVWKVPNVLGKVMEVYVLPTSGVIEHNFKWENYPSGCVQIMDFCSGPRFPIIANEWILKHTDDCQSWDATAALIKEMEGKWK